MAKPARRKVDHRGELDWIVFSYQSLRRWVVSLLLLVAAAVWGVYIFRRNHESPQVRAQRQIERAETALDSAEKSAEASKFTATLGQAKDRLNDSRLSFQAASYEQAFNLALESESLSRRALGRSGNPEIGDATFVALDGEVSLQRAGRATWEECRLRQALYDGDFVKTGKSGSSEIMFADGTLYQLRPDSLFEVKRGLRPEHDRGSAVEMVAGSIQVYTSNSTSKVNTRAVSAEIQRDSQVGVSIDKDRNTEVANYRGQAVLRTEKESVVLSERERIEARAQTQRLGPKVELPESPSLVDPADNRIFDLTKSSEITLRWVPVKDAAYYRLQVSRSRLFIPDATPLDLTDRRGVTASIRPHEQGSYYWRVGAVTRAGVASEWSAYRRFRIVADASKSGAPEGAPPPLTLQRPLQMGNLFLIFGKTDPAASVSVNGQRADLEPDGTFKTTVTVDREGESQIVVKASDAAGRETVRRIRVYVELY
jgi:hypothetical protein